jgi:hypothetical protein
MMTGFKRPAVALFGVIAAFAIGQAGAQPVNPVPAPPPPTFNPSTPSIVPQTPETPVSPTAPGGLSGSSTAPVVVAPPAAVNRRTTDVSVKPSPSRGYVHHHASVHEHRMRVAGPSYYPGLGEFYPPYVNPCHFRPYWGAYPGYSTYTCSW